MEETHNTIAERLTGNCRSVDLSNLGLKLFPTELYAVADTLEQLNLGNNMINSLPDNLSVFKNLRILFFGQNSFETVPAVIGQLPALQMVSFKSNKVKIIDREALSATLTWLILSDNHLTELPSSIGKLTELRKLMLAGNKLSSLPEELQNCRSLELLRISANNLSSLPDWLLRMPRLSWLAYAGNLLDARAGHTSVRSCSGPCTKAIQWYELELGERIGEGASGVVHSAVWQPTTSDDDQVDCTTNCVVFARPAHKERREVAVKLFKGGTTSDGLPKHEMKASEAVGHHPSFIQVLGRLEGAPNAQLGLVFPLISSTDHRILGQPPSFATITRDTFPEGQRFTLAFALRCLVDIASACQHLHGAAGLTHGDLYAHNILTSEQGAALLTDFGAASFAAGSGALTAEQCALLERIEVRAFGCLVDDLLRHVEGAEEGGGGEGDRESESLSSMELIHGAVVSQLRALREDCCVPDVHNRPSFEDICGRLECIMYDD